MNVKTMLALGVACVLVGVLIGYLSWGLRSDSELAEVKARLAAEEEQAEQAQRQAKEKLTQAESRLKELAEDLEFERQRRARLEHLLSEGRK